MKVEFTNRAVGDLRKISAQSRNEFGASVAAALELRIRKVVEQIGDAPESAPRVEQRPGMRVLPLVHYPFKIFYRIVDGDTVRILHIRHTARRPWTEDVEGGPSAPIRPANGIPIQIGCRYNPLALW